MNKFVFSALATTLVGATSFASDTAWPELDSELAALNNAPLTQEAGGPYVTGWLIGALDWNADSEDLNSNKDSQGFNVHAARINLSGSVGKDYGYVIGMDFADTGELFAPGGTPVATTGTAGLTDAYATFAIGEGLNGQLGVFRSPFLRSSLIARNKTLFIDRSFLGGMNASRDAGVSLNGEFSRMHWVVAAQNGFDNQGEGWSFTGRVDMDVIGTSSNVEGSYNAAEGTNLNVGIALRDDTSDLTLGGASRKAFQWAIDATMTMDGGFSLFGEVVNNDDDIGNNSPWSAGVAYLFGENYEAALRFDDWDDTANTTRYNIGVNKYVSGHDAKWQLQYSDGSSDITSNEDAVISLGLALGF
jgi:hypothetical protein